jgi:hypothetical protein
MISDQNDPISSVPRMGVDWAIRWQAVGHRTLRQCRLGKDSTVSGQRNTVVHQRGVRDIDLTFETY